MLDEGTCDTVEEINDPGVEIVEPIGENRHEDVEDEGREVILDGPWGQKDKRSLVQDSGGVSVKGRVGNIGGPRKTPARAPRGKNGKAACSRERGSSVLSRGPMIGQHRMAPSKRFVYVSAVAGATRTTRPLLS